VLALARFLKSSSVLRMTTGKKNEQVFKTEFNLENPPRGASRNYRAGYPLFLEQASVLGSRAQ